MRAMQIVRRTYRDIVGAFPATAQLVNMGFEQRKVGKETRRRKRSVHLPDRIGNIERGAQLTANIADGLQVPTRNVAGNTDDCETHSCRASCHFQSLSKQPNSNSRVAGGDGKNLFEIVYEPARNQQLAEFIFPKSSEYVVLNSENEQRRMDRWAFRAQGLSHTRA